MLDVAQFVGCFFILNHREWNWNDVLEMLENIFRRKVEGYS